MSKPDHPVLETVDAPWSEALVLVCSECDGGRGTELAQHLKDAVRTQLEKDGRSRKDIRVARVRCLGICPKRGVAVTIAGASRRPENYVVAAKDKAAVPALRAAVFGSIKE